MTAQIRIPAGATQLDGTLTVPDEAKTLVLFVHGSGSSRHSPRNQFVARTLNDAGLATLLFDLLTRDEESIDSYTAQFRFDIALLAERLLHATNWAGEHGATRELRIGYFGSSTGGAAALVAAAELPQNVIAVVSRGGRPDLAGDALIKVRAPTLLIVGGKDEMVIELNEQAQRTGATRNADTSKAGNNPGSNPSVRRGRHLSSGRESCDYLVSSSQRAATRVRPQPLPRA